MLSRKLRRVVTAQWLPNCLAKRGREMEREEGREQKEESELGELGETGRHPGKTITQMQLPILLSYIRQLNTHGHTQTQIHSQRHSHVRAHTRIACGST